jgi:SNF2 family DNA or RNA helicase
MVTTVIPTARKFDLLDTPLVTVPHRLDEVKVLRNLGIKAPSPILTQYPWPGRFTPFDHQRETAAFLTLNDKAFVLLDIGLGKTLTALWAFHYLKSIGTATKMLVLASLSTLERIKLLNTVDHDIAIINHHGAKVILRELIAAGYDTVCVDEVATFRNASSDLWKALRAICSPPHVKRIWGLTGKPIPNEPTDAWAQCRIISPQNVPRYFNQFRSEVMQQVGQFAWLPRREAPEIVSRAMQPAIHYRRDDCLDLPPCLYITREVPMEKAQARAYETMKRHMVIEATEGRIIALNEGVKLSKLLQIACGAAYSEDQVVVYEPGLNRRVDEIELLVSEAAGKVIVYVPFKSVLGLVADRLRKRGHLVEQVSGETSKNERDRIFGAFQQPIGPRILVAQPAAMSHGLTLTEANTIIWYSAVTSNETYEQANGRITRPGQMRNQLIVELEGSSAERHVFSRLRRKQSMQGALLELLLDTPNP